MAYQPKSYKKFVATAATATLVASAIAPVASAATFTDVNSNYTEAVNYLVANKIAQGTTETTFGTTASITRGDAAVMIANALGLDTSKAPESAFTDLNNRVKGAVNALSAAGIINGKSATQFAPADNITRAEMAKVIALAYKLDRTGTTNEFTDVNSTFDEYVDALVKYEITLGKTESLFGATQNVTRGEFALFVFRAENLTPATPEVVSVSAINAREITVEFNSALDDVTASNAANYALTVAGVSTAFTVDFDTDSPKSVKLVLADGVKLTNNNAVQLVVKKSVLQDKTLVGMKEDFTKVWVFSDTVAPKVTKVEKTGDDVVVTFDEYVSTVEIIKVNGVSYPAVTVAASPSTKSITIANGALNLAAGTYEVLLSGVSDISGNKSSVVTGSFSVSNDTTAPSITKVKQTGDAELQITFDKAVTLVGTGNFTVKKGGYDLAVTPTTTDNKTYTLALADAGAIKVYDTGVDSSSVTLTVTGIKSTANNAVANPYTSALTLSKDKTAPTVLTRFNTITDTDATAATFEVFDINFNEELVLDAGFVVGDITLTDKDGVRQAVTGATVVNDANGDAKILRVESTNVHDVNGAIKAGNYNINLSAGVVADNAGNGIAATNVAMSKTTAAATVTASATALNNVISISYGVAMSTTATSAANYMLDGKALPAGTNIYFNGSTQNVVIELPAGTVKSTGGAVLSISDSVVSTSGTKLTAASKTQNITSGFVDNVKPKLASAKKLNANEIELTFDENLDDAGLAALAADNDFVVSVNGVNFAYTASTGTTASDNKVLLTTTAAYNTAQTVTVSVTTTAANVDLADAAGNKLTTGTAVTAN